MLLQMIAGAAGDCGAEKLRALALLVCLCATLVGMLCAFAFFREDKEEQITPLCPQLVVKEAELRFRMPLDAQVDAFEVTDMTGQKLCKVALDWPDPFRPGISGVAATVRLQNILELTLATVVARTPTLHVAGQGLALCRAGCEIFGFVEPDGDKRYHVRHRTGVHLLTLVGDFATCDIEGLNPVGSKVCEVSHSNGVCTGRVLQHVDAGLVICSLLATHVHRRLPQNNNNSDSMSAVSIPSPMPAITAAPPAQEAE